MSSFHVPNFFLFQTSTNAIQLLNHVPTYASINPLDTNAHAHLVTKSIRINPTNVTTLTNARSDLAAKFARTPSAPSTVLALQITS